MRPIILSFVIAFLTIVHLHAQIPPLYPEAPEKWSKPEPIEVISGYDSIGRAESPTSTADGKTVYFGAWVWKTQLTDTGWSKPKKLNSDICRNLVQDPIISPNGKRLFFTWWTGGGWYAFYSDWDSTANDWGPVTDAGLPNDPYIPGEPSPLYTAVSAGCFLDDTTLIFLKNTESFISHWHTTTAMWDSAVPWPYAFPNQPWDGLQFSSDCGIAVTPDQEKVYIASSRNDTTQDGQYYTNYDLIVFYRDTTNETGYGIPFTLNFSLQADSLYFAGEYEGRFEGFPSITSDGKTMFFAADYHGKETIYISHLLIDENGDTVTNGITEHPSIIPNTFSLYPAYPNPFNPQTTITYFVPTRSHIRLSVYDILGRRVRVLTDDVQSAGEHSALFDSSGLASGTYIVYLETPRGMLTRKVSLIK